MREPTQQAPLAPKASAGPPRALPSALDHAVLPPVSSPALVMPKRAPEALQTLTSLGSLWAAQGLLWEAQSPHTVEQAGQSGPTPCPATGFLRLGFSCLQTVQNS